MLFDYTKKITLITLGLLLFLSLPAAGQQNYLPGPSPALRGALQQNPRYNTYQTPRQDTYQPAYQMPHLTPRTYAPAPYHVAQLPSTTPNGNVPQVNNPLGPSFNPQQSAPPQKVPETFQPKSSQPVTIRPAGTQAVAMANTANNTENNNTAAPVVNNAMTFQPPQKTIMRKLQNASEKMEMVVNTSRILTLDKPIPQAQVNNPEILALTPLSPTQVQMSAKKAGVTQVNIWSDDGQIYSIDVLVVGDAQELRVILQTQFPSSSLRIVPVGQGGDGGGSVYISGYVDRPEDVTQVTQIAEQYYPKVINNVTVSGVQQVLLHAKVMEVSRTKLRTLGIDWAQVSGGNIVTSSVSGLIGEVTGGEAIPGWEENPNTGISRRIYDITRPSVTLSGEPTFYTSVVQGDNAFFGILEALREDQLAKVLAEPTLVTVNGQPASFLVGGEVPVPVPQSLGTISIEYKKYGTQLQFVPLVLGDGRIRMEVRPRVSELDRSTALFMDGFYIYGFRSREVKTSVEMDAGQTLAIAGLINERIESERRGLPWVSDVPVIGAFFRRVTEKNNEIEMLVFVTPELVDALDPDEVPPGGPGKNSCSPTDFQLYWKGHIETECCDTGCGSCKPCGYDMPGSCMETDCATSGYSPARETGIRTSTPRRVPLEPAEVIPHTSPISNRGATSYPARQNRYTPQNQIREASRTSLPGFKGRLGY